MINKKWLAIGLGILAMSGCSQAPAGNQGPQNSNSNASLEIVDKPVVAKLNLEDTAWKINSMTQDGKTIDLGDKNYKFTIKDGQAGVQICNSGGTAVRVEGDKLVSDGPVVSTMMFCEGKMDYEQAFFNGLDNDFKVEMKGDALVLTDGKAGVSFTLTAATAEEDVSETDWIAVLTDKSWSFTDMAKDNVATNWSENGYTFGLQGQSMVAKMCNSSNAPYELVGNKLSANGPVGSTKMFCEGKMEDETAFQNSMKNGLTLAKEGDQLILRDQVSGTEYRLK